MRFLLSLFALFFAAVLTAGDNALLTVSENGQPVLEILTSAIGKTEIRSSATEFIPDSYGPALIAGNPESEVPRFRGSTVIGTIFSANLKQAPKTGVTGFWQYERKEITGRQGRRIDVRTIQLNGDLASPGSRASVDGKPAAVEMKPGIQTITEKAPATKYLMLCFEVVSEGETIFERSQQLYRGKTEIIREYQSRRFPVDYSFDGKLYRAKPVFGPAVNLGHLVKEGAFLDEKTGCLILQIDFSWIRYEGKNSLFAIQVPNGKKTYFIFPKMDEVILKTAFTAETGKRIRFARIPYKEGSLDFFYTLTPLRESR